MPDTMRDAFREHHRLTDDEREAIWRDCTFVLDANVLLNIYRYAKATRQDLFRVMAHLHDRLWVPYQVAREFYANRLDVIRDQQKKYEELTQAVSRTIGELGDGTFHKSGFLNIGEIKALLQPAVTSALAAIQSQQNAHPDLIRDDPYLEELVSIVGTSIGNDCGAKEREAEAITAQARIDRQQPPGFRDAKKPAPERYGDVFIWFELLRLAEKTKRPVVFITDDDKEDWWLKVAGKTLGPRPELREEMRKSAGVDFYLYNPANWLERVGKDLAVSIPKSSIDDAETTAAELRSRQLSDQRARPDPLKVGSRSELYGGGAFDRNLRAAEVAVGHWLSGAYPQQQLIPKGHRPFDYLMEGPSGRIAVEVKLLRNPTVHLLVGRFLRDLALRAYFDISQGRLDDFLLVLVSTELDLVLEATESLQRRPLPEPAFPVSVGLLADDNYVEYYRHDERHPDSR